MQTSSSTRGRYGKSPLRKKGDRNGFVFFPLRGYFEATVWTFHVEGNVRLGLLIQNSPGERVRKLKAMFARGTMVSMQLSPLVSMKS